MAEKLLRKYGWRPDVPDKRDAKYSAPPSVLQALPPAVDFSADMPPIWDQGELGSCSANATCGQCWYLDKTMPFEPSRLFVYYNTRILEGTVKEDSGASIRNSIKSVVRWGFCAESDWPYDINKFTKKPPTKAYKSALTERVTQYARVQQVEKQIKAVLAQKLPVNFGFAVYESFESDEVTQTGVVPMPKKDEKLYGGHAVILCAFSDEKKMFKVRNSWGTAWGDKGYFYMPYAYVLDPDLADDFWMIKAVP